MTGVSRASVANYIKSYVELGATLDEVLGIIGLKYKIQRDC